LSLPAAGAAGAAGGGGGTGITCWVACLAKAIAPAYSAVYLSHSLALLSISGTVIVGSTILLGWGAVGLGCANMSRKKAALPV